MACHGQVRGVLGLWRDLQYWAFEHEDVLAKVVLCAVLFGLAGWLVHWFF